jgi:hypothetical protein
MNNGSKWLKIAWQRVSLTLLTILLCFWIIKLVYCGHGYFTNGMAGLQTAIIHGALVPHDPMQWGKPRWDVIALQYSGIALMTGMLGLANGRALKNFWSGLRHHFQPNS